MGASIVIARHSRWRTASVQQDVWSETIPVVRCQKIQTAIIIEETKRGRDLWLSHLAGLTSFVAVCAPIFHRLPTLLAFMGRKKVYTEVSLSSFCLCCTWYNFLGEGKAGRLNSNHTCLFCIVGKQRAAKRKWSLSMYWLKKKKNWRVAVAGGGIQIIYSTLSLLKKHWQRSEDSRS